jgi:hypothetical protein
VEYQRPSQRSVYGARLTIITTNRSSNLMVEAVGNAALRQDERPVTDWL